MNDLSMTFRQGAPAPCPAPAVRSAALRPGPGATWAAVCFHPPVTSADACEAGLRRWSARVVWRSATGYGWAAVRLTARSYAAPDAPHPPCDVHLRADPDTARRPAEYADVLVTRVPLPLPAARRRVRDLLVRRPGCLVAAVPDVDGGSAVGVRDGADGLRYVRLGEGESGVRVPPTVVASVVHAWVAAGGWAGALRCVAVVPPGVHVQ